MMLYTHSSLETLDVGGEDRVRHSRFPTDTLHHLHLVCHLPLRQKQQKLISAEENAPPPFLNTAVSVQPSVGCVRIFHMNCSGRTNPPVEPILGIQSWWPQWLAALTLTTCQSGELLSRLAQQSESENNKATRCGTLIFRGTDTKCMTEMVSPSYITHELCTCSVSAQQRCLKTQCWAVLMFNVF